MEAELKQTKKELKIVTKMAQEVFDDFAFDDEKIIFYDEREGIKKAIKEVAPKVVKVAKKYKLPRKAIAAIVAAVAMSKYLSFVRVEVECRCSLNKITKVMRELGFERVKSKCMEEVILDGALNARWNVAEEFFEALGRDFVVLHVLPIDEDLIFEPRNE